MHIKLNTSAKAVSLSLFLCLPNSGFSNYEIQRHSINSGSMVLESDRFEMQATIGQTDDSATLTSESLQMNGTGFWHKNTDLIFKNDLD